MDIVEYLLILIAYTGATGDYPKTNQKFLLACFINEFKK